MPYRELHDDIPISKTLSRLSHLAFRLYIHMLSQTDPWGRLTGDHDKLRALCIPTLAVTERELHQAICDLVAVGRIDVYVEQGIHVSQIVGFDERQRVAKTKRAPSRYPDRTALSTSPYDLSLSLPLSTDGPETCADAALSLPDGRPGLSDLVLSNGGAARRGPARKFDHDEARERLLAGESARSIARSYGVSADSVSRVMADSFGRNSRKTPAKSVIDRQKTEDRRESPSPTAEARPAGEILSIGKEIEASLALSVPRPTPPPTPPPLPKPRLFADGGGVAYDPEDLAALAVQLAGADARTVNVLASLRRRGLPFAAFALALESLEERRGRGDLPPVRNEVRFVVGALKTMLREGKYVKEAAA